MPGFHLGRIGNGGGHPLTPLKDAAHLKCSNRVGLYLYRPIFGAAA